MCIFYAAGLIPYKGKIYLNKNINVFRMEDKKIALFNKSPEEHATC